MAIKFFYIAFACVYLYLIREASREMRKLNRHLELLEKFEYPSDTRTYPAEARPCPEEMPVTFG